MQPRFREKWFYPVLCGQNAREWLSSGISIPKSASYVASIRSRRAFALEKTQPKPLRLPNLGSCVI